MSFHNNFIPVSYTHLSENGEPGQERELELELKVLADVGLVGFPSVGKSTLLSAVSYTHLKFRSW